MATQPNVIPLGLSIPPRPPAGIQPSQGQPQAPIRQQPPARIVTHKDGSETLPDGSPLYSHPLVRTRAQNSSWALHDACEIGDLFFVKAFFAPGRDGMKNLIHDPSLIDKRDLYAQTPLHLALLNGRYEIAKILIQNGANASMGLEGMTNVQVLLTLIGSFPQYQIPLLQPTPHLLKNTVLKLDSVTKGIVPTQYDLITKPHFAPFQSYGVKMLILYLDHLHTVAPREIFKRDDNGRNIFHFIAQYDLVEPLTVCFERLFYNNRLSSGLTPSSPSLTEEDQLLFQRRRQNFCIALLGQDNQYRNIFHYCAQYRSSQVLVNVFNFIRSNLSYFPTLSSQPLSKATSMEQLTSSVDLYNRSPLHYAFQFAAPFYIRSKDIPLSQVYGKLYRIEDNIIIDNSNDDDNSKELKLNLEKLKKDPIVKLFLDFDNEIKQNLAQKNENYLKITSLIGSLKGLDLYKRTPYQNAVLNQPISGSNNAGNIVPIGLVPNPTALIETSDLPKIKPTLIGWSPRCFEHHTATKIVRNHEPPPPENVRRLQVLLNFTDGVLRSNEFNHRVSQADILALNQMYYLALINQLTEYSKDSNKCLEDMEIQRDSSLTVQALNSTIDTNINTCSSTVLNLGDSTQVDANIYTKGAQFNDLLKAFSPTSTASNPYGPVIPQNVLHWNHRAPRATFSDVLRCHDYGYITRLMSVTENVAQQDDWGASTSEHIDVLHRDLHVSVPNIISLQVDTMTKTYKNSMDFYGHVMETARELSILPPHSHNISAASNTALTTPGKTVGLINQRNSVFAPLSNLAQSILYRERSLLNLNLGFANLLNEPNEATSDGRSVQKLYNVNNMTEQELLLQKMKQDATNLVTNPAYIQQQLDVIDTRDQFLGDAHELYDSALFPAQVKRSLEKNQNTGIRTWRLRLTPTVYTNSIIQSSSLVPIIYHYPNYDAIKDQIDPFSGAYIGPDDDGDDGGDGGDGEQTDMKDDTATSSKTPSNASQTIKLRERTTSYAGELSTTTPAPSITRHAPPSIQLRHLDDDTAVSAFSWFAALFAGGTVIDAVKRVVQGQYKNAFCAVRPPGHHSGPNGLVSTDEQIGDSHGFCLLNNVAIGAAYAKAMFPDVIKRVAIIDFDVHHGNGTESIVEKLQPRVVQKTIQLATNPQFGTLDRICLSKQVFQPWHDSQDVDEVLFASVHGYHKSTTDQFYPGTGRTTEGLLDTLVDQNRDPYRIIACSVELTEEEKLQFFSSTITDRNRAVSLLRQYMQSRDDENRSRAPKKPYVSPILIEIFGDEDLALDYVVNSRSPNTQNRTVQRALHDLTQNLPSSISAAAVSAGNADLIENDVDRSAFGSTAPSIYPGDLPTDLPIHLALEKRRNRILNAGLGKDTKAEWRQVWQHSIIPGIVSHKPDLIMISAGFDAHHRDKINGGHVGIDEDDYYWITKQLMKVANLCCEGRIVSCLEGGYRIHCGLVSPFSRSVAAHVRALHEGGNEPWTPDDVDVELKVATELSDLRTTLARIHETHANARKAVINGTNKDSGSSNSNPVSGDGKMGRMDDGDGDGDGNGNVGDGNTNGNGGEQDDVLDQSNIMPEGSKRQRKTSSNVDLKLLNKMASNKKQKVGGDLTSAQLNENVTLVDANNGD